MGEDKGKYTVVNPGGGGLRGRTRGLLGTLVALTVILLVFVFFAARTDFARRKVVEMLSARLGMPVTVARTSIVFPYDLSIEKLKTEPVEEHPGLTVDEVRIGVSRHLRWKVRVNGAAVQVQQGLAGAWSPAVFESLGRMNDVDEISAMTDGFEKSVLLEVRSSSIQWLDAQRVELASASGIRFEMVPVRLPGRNLMYYRLFIRHAYGGRGLRTSGMEREWMSPDDNAYIEIARREGAELVERDDTRWKPLEASAGEGP